MKLANQLILGAILAVGLLSSIVSSAPFTKGNILVLKGDFVEDESCTRGYLNELTPSGEFVQEIALPTEETEASYPCLIAAGDYSSRLTVSNDGYRAIMACCNVVNETDSFLQSFAVIYGNGLIQITRPTLQNGTRETIYNAVLDGEDVWYSAPSNIFHTTLGANTSTLIFEGDILSIRSYDGNLYASNYDRLPYAIMQVGEGLPKELSEGTVFLNETATSVNGFEFTSKYLITVNYPEGLYIYDKATLERVYANDNTEELVQFVLLETEGKILAQSYPVIYEFSFSEENGLSNATLWFNRTETNYFYSPILVPENNCLDGIKNFDESDVDCGGSMCSQCVDGKTCSLGSDCAAEICLNGVCGMPAPVGTPSAAPTSAGTLTAYSLVSVTFVIAFSLLG